MQRHGEFPLLRRAEIANATWAVLEYLCYPVLVLLFTPLILRVLGADRYALWMLLTATVSVGTFLSIGTAAGTMKCVSEAVEANARTVEMAIRSSLGIAIATGAAAAITTFAVFFCFGDVFFPKIHEQTALQWTGVIAAILLFIEQIDNVFASALKGAEKFGTAARCEMASKVVQICSVVASLRDGLLGIYIVLVAVALLRTSFKGLIVFRALPVTTIRPQFTRLNAILRYARWGWLQGAGGLLLNVADRFIVAYYLGAQGLTHYALAIMLPQQIHALTAAGCSILFPFVSRRRAANPAFSLKVHVFRFAILGVLCPALFVLILLALGRVFLQLWLPEIISREFLTAYYALVLAYGLLAMNVAPHFMLMGLGRMKYIALINIAAGAISVIVLLSTLNSWGLAGTAMARAAYAVITLGNVIPLIMDSRMTKVQTNGVA